MEVRAYSRRLLPCSELLAIPLERMGGEPDVLVRRMNLHTAKLVKEKFPVVWLAVVLLTTFVPNAAWAQPPTKSGADSGGKGASEVTLRGRVVCLAEEMNRLHGADLPTDHPHVLGFRTAE